MFIYLLYYYHQSQSLKYCFQSQICGLSGDISTKVNKLPRKTWRT